jgi:hypothetical protein
MGTSGSYSGSGGKPGKDLRRELEEWLDQLPPNPPDERPPADPDREPPPDQPPSDQPPPPTSLPPTIFQNLLPFLRPRATGGGGSDGPGGGGGLGGGGERTSAGRRTGGGPQRTAAASAGSAGRAAAAAYAYQTGDAAGLEGLGLNYDELRNLSDPLEITSRIVAAACGPIGESTIEDMEQRYVAAQVAEWVFEQGSNALPTPDEIARKTISLIIVETLESETGELLRDGKRPIWATEIAETELREAADALAERATLSVEGPSAEEFAAAIEDGIETLREILGGSE